MWNSMGTWVSGFSLRMALANAEDDAFKKLCLLLGTVIPLSLFFCKYIEGCDQPFYPK